jgi:hypothetical protein
MDRLSGVMRVGGAAAGGPVVIESWGHVQVGVTFSVTATDADMRKQVAGLIAYGEGEERKMEAALGERLFDATSVGGGIC